MVTVTWVISVALLVVSFFASVFIAKFKTKPVDDQKFSFMRMFPFESAKEGRGYLYSLYLFSGICFTTFLVLFEGSNKLEALNGLSIIICVLLGLDSIVFIFLNIFDVTHTKTHLYLFLFMAFLTLLSGALSFTRALVSYKTCLKYGSNEYLFIICEILSGISVAFTLAFCLNPKLLNWAKLDVVEGEVNKYVRPKHFVLAYSEWALYLLLFVNVLLYFVQLLVK